MPGAIPRLPQIFSESLVMLELAKTAKLLATPTFNAAGPTCAGTGVGVGAEFDVGVLEPHPAIKAAGSNAIKNKPIIFFTVTSPEIFLNLNFVFSVQPFFSEHLNEK